MQREDHIKANKACRVQGYVQENIRTVPQFNIRVTHFFLYTCVYTICKFCGYSDILILKVTKPKPVTLSWVVTIVGAGPAQTLLHVHVWYVKLTTDSCYVYI